METNNKLVNEVINVIRAGKFDICAESMEGAYQSTDNEIDIVINYLERKFKDVQINEVKDAISICSEDLEYAKDDKDAVRIVMKMLVDKWLEASHELESKLKNFSQIIGYTPFVIHLV